MLQWGSTLAVHVPEPKFRMGVCSRHTIMVRNDALLSPMNLRQCIAIVRYWGLDRGWLFIRVIIKYWLYISPMFFVRQDSQVASISNTISLSRAIDGVNSEDTGAEANGGSTSCTERCKQLYFEAEERGIIINGKICNAVLLGFGSDLEVIGWNVWMCSLLCKNLEANPWCSKRAAYLFQAPVYSKYVITSTRPCIHCHQIWFTIPFQ